MSGRPPSQGSHAPVKCQKVSGSQSFPSFPQGADPWRSGAVSGFGEADRYDATEGSDLDAVAGRGTMDRLEDGPAQPGCVAG